LHEILTADRLGFEEAWISEHIGFDRPDTMPAPELFICKAATLTKRIRFGSAVRCLPLYHPIDVATQAAVCDHMTGGRYMFGFGTGAPMSGMEQRGLDRNLCHEMTQEAIELVLRCWRETEAFDYDGEFYRGRNIRVFPKPFQQPRMPLAMASGHDALLKLAAEHDVRLLLGLFDNAAGIGKSIAAFDSAVRTAGHVSRRKDVAVSRKVYVADTTKQALDDLRRDVNRDIEEEKIHARHQFRHCMPPSGKLEDIDFDYMVDVGMFIAGDPDTVCAGVKHLYGETGGFGILLLAAGKDWTTRAKRARSFKMFKEYVAPGLERLDPDELISSAA